MIVPIIPISHMKVSTTTHKCLAATMLLGTLAAPLHAWEPDTKELDAAISSGDFAGYPASASSLPRPARIGNSFGVTPGSMAGRA